MGMTCFIIPGSEILFWVAADWWIFLKPQHIKPNLSGRPTYSAVGGFCNLCGQTLDLSLTAATLPLSRPSFRVKARWTRTGWLAIRTTACRTTVWFVTGTPTRPERRRRWQEVRSLWALWVELVQFSSCLSLSWTCYPPSVLSVLQITVCLFWNKAVHFCFSFLYWSSYLTVSHCMLFMFCEYFGPLSLVSPFHLRYPQNYIYLHVFLCSGLFT